MPRLRLNPTWSAPTVHSSSPLGASGAMQQWVHPPRGRGDSRAAAQGRGRGAPAGRGAKPQQQAGGLANIARPLLVASPRPPGGPRCPKMPRKPPPVQKGILENPGLTPPPPAPRSTSVESVAGCQGLAGPQGDSASAEEEERWTFQTLHQGEWPRLQAGAHAAAPAGVDAQGAEGGFDPDPVSSDSEGAAPVQPAGDMSSRGTGKRKWVPPPSLRGAAEPKRFRSSDGGPVSSSRRGSSQLPAAQAELVQPKAEPVGPKVEPVQPQDEPVQPQDEPVQPQDQPVQPQDQPVQPQDQPVQLPVEFVEPKVEPVQPQPEPRQGQPEEPAEQQKQLITQLQEQVAAAQGASRCWAKQLADSQAGALAQQRQAAETERVLRGQLAAAQKSLEAAEAAVKGGQVQPAEQHQRQAAETGRVQAEVGAQPQAEAKAAAKLHAELELEAAREKAAETERVLQEQLAAAQANASRKLQARAEAIAGLRAELEAAQAAVSATLTELAGSQKRLSAVRGELTAARLNMRRMRAQKARWKDTAKRKGREAAEARGEAAKATKAAAEAKGEAAKATKAAAEAKGEAAEAARAEREQREAARAAQELAEIAIAQVAGLLGKAAPVPPEPQTAAGGATGTRPSLPRERREPGPQERKALQELAMEEKDLVIAPVCCGVCSTDGKPYAMLVLGGADKGPPLAVCDLTVQGPKQVVLGKPGAAIHRQDVVAAWPTERGAILLTVALRSSLWVVEPPEGWRETAAHQYQRKERDRVPLEFEATWIKEFPGKLADADPTNCVAVSRCGRRIAVLVRQPTESSLGSALGAQDDNSVELRLWTAAQKRWELIRKLPRDATGLAIDSAGRTAAWYEPKQPATVAHVGTYWTAPLDSGAAAQQVTEELPGVIEAPRICDGYLLYAAGADRDHSFTTHCQWWSKKVASREPARALTPPGHFVDGATVVGDDLYVTYLAHSLAHTSSRINVAANGPGEAQDLAGPGIMPLLPGHGVDCGAHDMWLVHAAEDHQTLPQLIVRKATPGGRWEDPERLRLPQPAATSTFPAADSLSRRVEITQVCWKAADQSEVHGALFAEPTAPCNAPLLVLAHSGPSAPVRMALGLAAGCSDPEYGYIRPLLAAGYRVLAPAYRGSPGFGDAWSKATIGRLGQKTGDIGDIAAGVHHLRHIRVVSEEAPVGIFGTSYGGYLTMRALSEYPDVFDAGVSISGFANHFGVAEVTGDFDWCTELRCTAGHNVDPSRIRRPLLLIHGSLDQVCPVSQSQAVFHSLKRRGVECRLIQMPKEGHNFHKGAQHEARLAVLEWMLRHVPRPPNWTASGSALQKLRPAAGASGSA
eukprot:TRINITY_DN4355_c0_g1_i6.p1 TRINITY_DN4355_c0_g1~~TRINITY_DN4355_c0_g1_i6.p1  ORF type:complete len:1351 (+),score=281.27 TRINITY_DN4355_c0_g1_i6:62-4054(+)